ncbi:hypothetical protein ACJMK2_029828 [Sinanodonta woodiana]|uniref:Uncharacterized protein n=2 Tax=Sinanodonta woodiana TaxID=1069815 RepID=A0ABD3XBF0_SINWO
MSPIFRRHVEMIVLYVYLCIANWGHAAMSSSTNNVNLVNAQTNLLRSLLESYDKRAVPLENSSEPVILSVGIRPINLVQLHEKQEILDTGVYIQQMWSDFRLRWDPPRFEGLHAIHIPVDLLWMPDLSLYNNAEVDFESMNTLAIVFFHGAVYYSPRARIRTMCDINMYKFPFDTQTCHIKLGSWTYDGNRIKLSHFQVNTTLDMSDFTLNKEWDVVETSTKINTKYYSCCPEPYEHMQCTLVLKRNPTYYRHMFLLPAVLLALIVPFQFVLPPNSKERLTLGALLLVGILLLIVMLQDFLPEAHPNLPALALYYCLSMLWISLSIISTIWVINVHERGPRRKKVPEIIRLIFLKTLKKMVCLGDTIYYPLEESETISLRGLDKPVINIDTASKSSDQTKQYSSKLERDVEEILRYLHSLVVRSTADEARNEIYSEWSQVALVIDRLLCFFFFVTFLVCSFVLLA